MIKITPQILLDEKEIQEEFIRSSGPGGQNVNKVSTAVHLRFDVKNSPSLSGKIRNRLVRLAGSRMTKEGVLVIKSERHRTRELNRRDAFSRLADLIIEASKIPKYRIRTKPSSTAKRRRLEGKRKRGQIKKKRQRVSRDDY
ncbi:alternative ribosome rescue aminoacyl-tRNA hydrolase ArfB [Thermodesulfobacteriota bacterium]